MWTRKHRKAGLTALAAAVAGVLFVALWTRENKVTAPPARPSGAPIPAGAVLIGEPGDGDYDDEFRPFMIPPPSKGPGAPGCRRESGPPKACPVSGLDRDAPDTDRDCVIYVPGGRFLMGAQSKAPDEPGYDPRAEANEAPPHWVRLSPYWLHKYEVAAGDYAACVAAGACSEDSVRAKGMHCTYGDPDLAGHPVNGVTWRGASDYCAWIGGSLPTEAQWELAARGSDGRRFPWGNTEPDCGLVRMARTDAVELWDDEFSGCMYDGTRPVARPTYGGRAAFGATDMAGSVWEWVADRYGEYAVADPPETDPVGPAEGSRRIQRGGGFDDGPAALRSARRAHLDPRARLCDVGFRCAFSLD